MKQHAATWAPDDFKPRKGPHRLARSSTRRRLCVVMDGCSMIDVFGAGLTVVTGRPSEPGPKVISRLAPDSISEVPLARAITVYGPAGEVWGEAMTDFFRWQELRCPSLDGRQAPSSPSPLLQAAGFRVTRRPLANLARAEQALSR